MQAAFPPEKNKNFAFVAVCFRHLCYFQLPQSVGGVSAGNIT